MADLSSAIHVASSLGVKTSTVLLMNALRRCYQLSRQIGILAVVVDAKDDRARAFHEAFEFRRFRDEPYRLYIPMCQLSEVA